MRSLKVSSLLGALAAAALLAACGSGTNCFTAACGSACANGSSCVSTSACPTAANPALPVCGEGMVCCPVASPADGG